MGLAFSEDWKKRCRTNEKQYWAEKNGLFHFKIKISLSSKKFLYKLRDAPYLPGFKGKLGKN